MLAADEPLVEWDWVSRNADEIQDRLWQHVSLTVVAVGIGFLLALVMALVAVRWRWTYGPLAGLAGVLYAIPALALFGLLVSFPFSASASAPRRWPWSATRCSSCCGTS